MTPALPIKPTATAKARPVPPFPSLESLPPHQTAPSSYQIPSHHITNPPYKRKETLPFAQKYFVSKSTARRLRKKLVGSAQVKKSQHTAPSINPLLRILLLVHLPTYHKLTRRLHSLTRCCLFIRWYFWTGSRPTLLPRSLSP